MTVVIPAAGLGSRMGSFTKNYSKAMLTLGGKPIFSYIIENFTKSDEIIVLLGYKGDLLKQCIEACYPDWNISFVNVDKYEGEGSGLGYSLLCARDKLNKPFMFWSCDTVLYDIDKGESPFNVKSFITGDKNVLFTSDAPEGHEYDYRFALFTSYMGMEPKKLSRILPKGEGKFSDPDEIAPYIGVAYINDWQDFWAAADKNREAFIESGESFGINAIKNTVLVKNIYNWIDTGNRSIYEDAKTRLNNKMEDVILEKPDEAIWFVDNKVIKFHIDPKFILGRVSRIKTLLNKKQKLSIRVPELLSYSNNTYTYVRANGKIMSKNVTPPIFNALLKDYIGLADVQDFPRSVEFYNDFYKDKTLKRIQKFVEETGEPDEPAIINGRECLSAVELVNKLNFEELAKNAKFSYEVHGDFHLENVLVDFDKCEFVLLDWRQNFGNEAVIGDIYYDLGKMMHSLIVNHNMVKKNEFSVSTKKENGKSLVKIDIANTFIDNECMKELVGFCSEYNFSVKHMSIICALIFLNICACHTYPYSKFLYYLGRYLLQDLVS